ncbi:MAG: 4-hydroxy-tetrahydrodipicolinate synthase [Brumimicrobium sp.]
MEIKFRGTGVALVTPFKNDGSVDEVALRKLVDYQIQNGTDFLVVQGSTGEAATLTENEKQQTLSIIIDQNDGNLPIVLGLGGNDTAAMVKQYQNMNVDGIDAFLCASPHYNKPSQKGMIAHYKAIAKVSKRPIILYNVPGRTASNLLPETVLELAKIDNIIGIKEASGNLFQVMGILKNKPKDFVVLSGEDALATPISLLGGDGVISVVANALPKQFSSMMNAAIKGNGEVANPIHYSLLNITNSFFEEGNPSGVKYCLKLLGICNDTVRLPLTDISDGLKQKMRTQLEII